MPPPLVEKMIDLSKTGLLALECLMLDLKKVVCSWEEVGASIDGPWFEDSVSFTRLSPSLQTLHKVTCQEDLLRAYPQCGGSEAGRQVHVAWRHACSSLIFFRSMFQKQVQTYKVMLTGFMRMEYDMRRKFLQVEQPLMIRELSSGQAIRGVIKTIAALAWEADEVASVHHIIHLRTQGSPRGYSPLVVPVMATPSEWSSAQWILEMEVMRERCHMQQSQKIQFEYACLLICSPDGIHEGLQLLLQLRDEGFCSPKVLHRLTLAHLKLGRHGQAKKDVDRWLDLEPRDGVALLLRSIIEQATQEQDFSWLSFPCISASERAEGRNHYSCSTQWSPTSLASRFFHCCVSRGED